MDRSIKTYTLWRRKSSRFWSRNRDSRIAIPIYVLNKFHESVIYLRNDPQSKESGDTFKRVSTIVLYTRYNDAGSSH